MCKKEFSDLVNDPIWGNEFIGYGNPYSEILIIGQEVAYDEEKDRDELKTFYLKNCQDWKRTLIDNPEPRAPFEGEKYEYPIFVPSFPFKPQKATTKYGEGNSGPTYYWYQQLIDAIFEKGSNQSGYIDFFEKAFITELNGKPRRNHRVGQKEIKEQIAHRLDLMKASHQFWSHFKVVLFLCGSYAKALDVSNYVGDIHTRQELFHSIFGNALPFYGPQFSGKDRTRLHPKQWIADNREKIIQALQYQANI